MCRFVVCGLSNLHAQRFLHKGKDKGEAVASPRNPARTVFFLAKKYREGLPLKKLPPGTLVQNIRLHLHLTPPLTSRGHENTQEGGVDFISCRTSLYFKERGLGQLCSLPKRHFIGVRTTCTQPGGMGLGRS